MPASPPSGTAPRPAALLVSSPSGARTRVRIEHFPFRIGRLGDNDLILRDGRASRHHAQILNENGDYVVKDLRSSYGVFVNGERMERAVLQEGDLIEFGFPDSYRLTFTLADERSRGPSQGEYAAMGSSNLAKLRATLEVARALQSSLSTDEVLTTVVEAALAVTGCERGFLLLRSGDDLKIRIARSRDGALSTDDLRIPTRMLLRALNQRREFLSMNFNPREESDAGQTIADLELRSVVCVPLVRIRSGVAETTAWVPGEDSVGVLYMDSRLGNADLSAGGRELLTTLALEASTVLENARLLEEQWARQRLEQELKIAREIQQNLRPRSLPSEGWFRAAASSVASDRVAGDYYDVRQTGPDTWAAIVVDVSGKGVGAALVAALLEGMFLAAPLSRLSLEEMMVRVNAFLNERTGGEQYATVFYCVAERSGIMRWVNAGHPPPLLLRASGRIEPLSAGSVPVGMLEGAAFQASELVLCPGDRILIYSDGLTEAANRAGQFFGKNRLRDVVLLGQGDNAKQLHDRVEAAALAFMDGAPPRDDLTIAVVEYAG